MKTSLLLILLTLAGCSTARPAPIPVEPRDVVLRLDIGENKLCSGTAVGPSLILTAWHCIKDEDLRQVNGQPVKVVSAVKFGADAAVVEIEGMRFTKWAKRGPLPQEGERIRYWGNPSGMGMIMYREGYVSAVDPEGRGVAIDITICHGDSGAGIFNNAGEVVAVVSMMSDQMGCTFMLGVTP